jgi:hypothetical protein
MVPIAVTYMMLYSQGMLTAIQAALIDLKPLLHQTTMNVWAAIA